MDFSTYKLARKALVSGLTFSMVIVPAIDERKQGVHHDHIHPEEAADSNLGGRASMEYVSSGVPVTNWNAFPNVKFVP